MQCKSFTKNDGYPNNNIAKSMKSKGCISYQYYSYFISQIEKETERKNQPNSKKILIRFIL